MSQCWEAWMSQDKSKIYISESIKDLVDITLIPDDTSADELCILYDNRRSRILKFRRDAIPAGSYSFPLSFSFLITSREALEYLKCGVFKPIKLCLGTEIRKISPVPPVELELIDDDMYICTIST